MVFNISIENSEPLTSLQVAQFLTNNEVVNGVMDHFKPYAHSCNYCSIKFDAIFDVGTLQEDLSQIAQGLQIKVRSTGDIIPRIQLHCK